MLCIFFLFCVNVLCEPSSPLLPVADKQLIQQQKKQFIQQQITKDVLPMLLQPKNFAQNLIQNKTLLSELANADPAIVNQIIDLLENLLNENTLHSDALTAGVAQALLYKNANASDLADAQGDKEDADDALAAAIVVLNARQDDYDASVIVHDTEVQEQADQQPVLTSEAGIINDVLVLLRGLLPNAGPKVVTFVGQGACLTASHVPPTMLIVQQYKSSMTSDDCKAKALGMNNVVGYQFNTFPGDGVCAVLFNKDDTNCDGGGAEEFWHCFCCKSDDQIIGVSAPATTSCYRID